MFAIICAMKEEINEIILLMEDVKYENVNHIKIATGKLNNIDCAIALCGVGKVNAAICTQTLIMKYRPDFILNVGVAGGIDEKIKIGDAVVADGAIQHDFDISAFPNRKKGEISGIDCVKMNCSAWIVDKLIACGKDISEFKIHKGIILTGDQFINSKEKLISLKNQFGGLACEMEAGSIAQTCILNKVDFALTRTISDGANENSLLDFNAFLKSSSKNAANLISKFIKSI